MTVSICPSGPDSLLTILDWLEREYESDGEGFYGNREIIRQAQEDGDLAILLEDDEVVAFMVGGASSWDILEVRPDKRRCKYGQMLAQHYIEQARLNDVCVLEIQCSPRTSIPFWKEMGFTMFPSDNVLEDRAYMRLDRNFTLPNDSPTVSVSIAFYHEEKKWKQQVEPIITYSPSAVCTSNEEIMLSNRVTCFDPHYRLGLNPVIGIEVGSNTIYLDKVKYDDAKKFGIQCDSWGTYYLDRILST